MQSIIKNYQALQELWEQAADVARDTEAIARIQGVASQMKTFEYFLASCLVRCVCAMLII